MRCRSKLWLVPILLGVLVAGGGLVAPQVVSAATPNGPTMETPGTTIANGICMQRVFIGDSSTLVSNSNLVNCTANDISLSDATNVSPATCQQGSTFTLTATFTTDVTANARYDAGFFFRIDGGANARGDGAQALGECSLSGLTNGSGPAVNLDGDTCGDLNAGTGEVTFTIPNVACEPAPGTNRVKLPYCTSWHSNAQTACTLFTGGSTTQADAFPFHPDTKSKCVCNDNFTIPVIVQAPSISVTKSGTPNPITEDTPTAVTYTATVNNTSNFGSVTITSLTDSIFGNITTTGSRTVNGKTWNVSATGCAVPQTIAAGSNYQCSFTVQGVTLDAGQSLTDSVCASGTGQGGSSVGPTCGDFTETSTPVPASATVTKLVTGFACAAVQYTVTVTNTDAVESLTLSSLSDNQFGDITTVHAGSGTLNANAVLATTCGQATGAGTLPATIAVGGTYTCGFTGNVCGSFTDIVTATVSDNDVPPSTATPTGQATVTLHNTVSGSGSNSVTISITSP